MTKQHDYWSEAGLNLMKEIDVKEPEWCLHIRFKDGSNPIFYRSISMHELCKQLSMWNENYKLWPDPVYVNREMQNFIWIFAERRENADA